MTTPKQLDALANGRKKHLENIVIREQSYQPSPGNNRHPIIRGITLSITERTYVLSIREGIRKPADWSEDKCQQVAAGVEAKIARARLSFEIIAEAIGLTGLVFAVTIRDGLTAVDEKGRPDNRTRAMFARIFADLKSFSGRYRGKQAKETPADVPAKRRGKQSDRGAQEMLGGTTSGEGAAAG